MFYRFCMFSIFISQQEGSNEVLICLSLRTCLGVFLLASSNLWRRWGRSTWSPPHLQTFSPPAVVLSTFIWTAQLMTNSFKKNNKFSILTMFNGFVRSPRPNTLKWSKIILLAFLRRLWLLGYYSFFKSTIKCIKAV